ncbi:MAG: glycosyltransferase family 39 protein [Chloroflexi bacterium]|nr:glycosyltransferase family 39 protein [Chloroflexota bacterium]
MDSSPGEHVDPRGSVRAFAPGSRIARVVEHEATAPMLAVAALLVALATQFSIARDMDIPFAGGGFVLAGLLFSGAAFASNRARRSETPPFALSRRWEIALLAGVIALAAFFRFYRFMEFPPGVWYDEAINGTDALWIMDHDRLTVWRQSNFGHSTLYFYLLIASFKVFGYSIFAMRLVPALAGLGAVFAFYFLARWLTGAVPALVATALLAVSRYAVTFSRISWEASLQPLLEIMAVYFFVRALETKSRIQFFLAGGSLAAGIYTYLGFRFVPFVMLFFVVYVAATEWRLLRSNIGGLVVYAASFVVVVAPLGQFAIRHQDLFLERTRAINVFREIDEKGSYDPLRSNIAATFKMMNVAGDKNGRHNLPGAPMLDSISAALLVLGAAASLWSIRSWRKGGMLGWLVLSVAPGAFTLSMENPSAIRTIGAIPPMFLLTGLAVAVLYRALAPSRTGVAVFGAIAFALVAASAGINYRDFYQRQMHSQAVYDAFQSSLTRVAELVAERAGSERVYVSGEFSHPLLEVVGRGKTYYGYSPARDLVLARGETDVLLIVDTRQFSMVPTLKRLYPHLTEDDYVDPFGRLYFKRIAIPSEDIDALHELHLTVHEGADASGRVLFSGRGVIDREWRAGDLGTSGKVTAVWEGYLWRSGIGITDELAVGAPGTVAIEIDGQPAASGVDYARASGAWPLGQHAVKITATIDRPGASTLAYTGDLGQGSAAMAADSLYGISAGERGFQVVYRDGRDFANPVIGFGHVPFAAPTDQQSTAQAVEYRAVFEAPATGEYQFVLDSGNSAQLFIDDELIVDNGGSHGPQRITGAASLEAGPHLLALQYLPLVRGDWLMFTLSPVVGWRMMDGSEVAPPSAAYAPPVLATLRPDSTWGGARQFDGLARPSAVTVRADGTAVVASGHTLGFIAPDGTLFRTADLGDGIEVSDLATAASGEIIAADRTSQTLLVLDGEGKLVRTIEGPFSSVSGIDVHGDTIYVASAYGGIVYSVPLAGGTPARLAVSDEATPNRAAQPSDIAVAPDGTLYLADFEKRRIVISRDRRTAKTATGVPGVGVLLPHAAFYKKLLLVADPLNQRVVMYDAAGKQRGVYAFPERPDGWQPVNLAAAPDGRVYVADRRGFVHRMIIDVPPDLVD